MISLCQNDIIGHGNGLSKAAEEDVRFRYVDEMISTMVKEKYGRKRERVMNT